MNTYFSLKLLFVISQLFRLSFQTSECVKPEFYSKLVSRPPHPSPFPKTMKDLANGE